MHLSRVPVHPTLADLLLLARRAWNGERACDLMELTFQDALGQTRSLRELLGDLGWTELGCGASRVALCDDEDTGPPPASVLNATPTRLTEATLISCVTHGRSAPDAVPHTRSSL